MRFSLWGIASFMVGAVMCLAKAESTSYLVFVSNERSGDVSVIDGATDDVVATFKVGKRPRGIHATPDGQRVFVTLSGSPRVAPGVDENRAPADRSADGVGMIDPVTRKLIDRWHVGSDPEQFAISKDGKFAFIANEDDASALIVDLNDKRRSVRNLRRKRRGVRDRSQPTARNRKNRYRRATAFRCVSTGWLARLRCLRERRIPRCY